MTLRSIVVSYVAGIPAVIGPIPAGYKEWGALIERDPNAPGGARRAFLKSDRGSHAKLLPSGEVRDGMGLILLERGDVIEWGGTDAAKGRSAPRRYWVILAATRTRILVDELKEMDARSEWVDRLEPSDGYLRCAEALSVAVGLAALTGGAMKVAALPLFDGLAFFEQMHSRPSLEQLRIERAGLVARMVVIDDILRSHE